MSGLPYEALRFANSVRANLGLKPATKLVQGTGNDIEATIAAGAKSVQVSTSDGTLRATRGKREVVRTIPMGAANYLYHRNLVY